MNPIEFVNSIYLGDRGLDTIIADSRNEIVKLQVDEISRIRDPSGIWNYYNDENIVNGYIVFSGVKRFVLNRTHPLLPSGFIELFSCKQLEDGEFMGLYEFEFECDDCVRSSNGLECFATEIKIIAKHVYLENPLQPGIKIET